MACWNLQLSKYPNTTPDLHHTIILKKRNVSLTIPWVYQLHSQSSKPKLRETSLTTIDYRDWDMKGLNTLPHTLLKTTDEKYVLLLGGYKKSMKKFKSFKSTDDIWLIDIENKRLLKSIIKLPIPRFNGACIIRKEKTENLLVFGYINKIWQST